MHRLFQAMDEAERRATLTQIRDALEYAVTFADVFAAAGTRNEFPNVNAVTVALKCRAALKLLPETVTPQPGQVSDHDIRD